jgi:hypothetical protein
MNVNVTAFTAVAVRDNGAVLLANDGTVAVLLDAAPVSNSRIDVIYAKQNDSSSTVNTPDANDLPVIGFVKGTASSLPTKPAVPAGAVELGTVQVSAGNTNTNAAVITQTAQYTAGPGGTVPVRTYDDLTIWASAGAGQAAYVFADPDPSLIGLYILVGGIGWTKQSTYEVDLVPSAGWTPGTGVNKPKLLVDRRAVTTFGTLTFGTGADYADIVTVPLAGRPPTMSANRILQPASVVSGVSLNLFRVALLTTGRIGQTTGATGSLPGAGSQVSLNGLTWKLD